MRNAFVEPLEGRWLLSGWSAHINFQPPGTATPKGYAADVGARFARHGALRFGWSAANKTGRAHASRLLADGLHTTLMSMQSGKQRLVWELALPAGLYSVHLVAGGPGAPAAGYRIKAEKSLVVNGSTTKKAPWIEGTAKVKVSDGRLTLALAPGSRGTWVDCIDVVPVPPPDAAVQLTMQAEEAASSSGVTAQNGVVSSLDNGDWIGFRDVDLAQGFRSFQVRLGTSSVNDAQTIEVHADAPDGALLGTLHTEGFGPVESFITQSGSLAVPAELMGRHDIYFRFSGTAPAGDLDWVRLSQRRFYTILPIGDSITEGKGGHDTYRRPLWKMLEQGGYSVDFEGTHRGLVQYSVFNQTEWDWDQDHEGHTGYRAHDVVEHLDGWFAQEAAPDIVLLHIGSNDIVMDGTRPEQIVVSVGQIIDKLRQYNPSITILLAQPIPCARTTYEIIRWYGQLLAQLAVQKNTAQSPIVLVDQFDGFDATTETYDGMHPTAEGEVKVAGKWFEALKGVLG